MGFPTLPSFRAPFLSGGLPGSVWLLRPVFGFRAPVLHVQDNRWSSIGVTVRYVSGSWEITQLSGLLNFSNKNRDGRSYYIGADVRAPPEAGTLLFSHNDVSQTGSVSVLVLVSLYFQMANAPATWLSEFSLLRRRHHSWCSGRARAPRS